MKINKQSNLYTIIYVAVIVLIVGAALAITSLSLKDRQQANIDADKMRQILASVHISGEGDNIISSFEKAIIAQRVYDATGRQAGDNAFAVDVAAESKKSDSERQLPVYIADLDGAIKFIIPLYGSGLWGPIWGYIAFDADCSTIFGAYFAHQGETPGLGAEIAKPAFSDQFDGKQVWHDGRFIPVDVVKKGMKPAEGADYVDGISGGTITSRGVASMIANCLTPYQDILKNLSNEFSHGAEKQ